MTPTARDAGFGSRGSFGHKVRLPVRTAPENRAIRDGETIVDLLFRRAEESPALPVYTFLSDEAGPLRELTFADLVTGAGKVASRLAREGLRGERVLLLHPAGLEFVQAFFGCLIAGVVAVPAPPPGGRSGAGRLAGIAGDSGAAAALAPGKLLRRLQEESSSHASLASLLWIASDGETRKEAEPPAARPRPESLAYLQYTSGSTSEPKGVMVGHGNLVANSEEIRRGFGHSSESRSLSWLPHYHDMGLVDGIVQPLYSGFRAFLMSPAAFLQSPARWLEAISRHRITHSGGPNFAFDLCVRRIEPDPARIDLHGWKVAYNGAEPVRAGTLERFVSVFSACGFRREAFYPAYGLAEATLKVSGGSPGEGPRILRLNRASLEGGRAENDDAGPALVGAGRPGHGTRVEVVDPVTGSGQPENAIGEIWVSGPSVARGYWSRSEESERTFGARLAGEPARFLRTGDLGFLRDGEIFVTGRIKDLIIIRGRNVYPQDIERTAQECHSSLRPGGGAAFGVEAEGEERLVLVQELDRGAQAGPAEIFGALREAIVGAHEVDPLAMVLVGPGSVPKTSSGKVRRMECRKAYLEGSLPAVARWDAPGTPDIQPSAVAGEAAGDAASWIAARVASQLGVSAASIDLHKPLAGLGLDSLRSLELAHEIGERFGVAISAVDLLSAGGLSEIIGRIESRSSTPAPADRAAGDEREESPLSVGQQAIWFLQELSPENAAYTISSALRLAGPLREEALERAAALLVARHPSLRARIVSGGEGPRQRFDVPFEAIYSRGDLGRPGEEELSLRLEEEAGRPFHFGEGPLFRLSLLRAGGERLLLLSAHHAIADLWSLSVALGDLTALYAAELGQAPPPALRPPHPAEFVRWQERWMGSEAGGRQLEFWRRRLAGGGPALQLPSDRPRPPAQSFAGAARTLRIEPALAASLRRLARSEGITLYTLLLAAYQAFLVRVTGQPSVRVGSPASGRTLPRFSNLVAYLVNAVVLPADLSSDPPFLDFARATRERVLESLQNQDFPFATLVKRLSPVRDPGRSPFFDTMFDFQGTGDRVRGDLAGKQGGARLELAGGVTASPVPVPRRGAQFDLSATVTDDGEGLSLEMEYSSDLFDEATAEDLARRYVTLLGSIAADPATRVSRLPLLDRDERRQVLKEANAFAVSDAAEPVHRLFEREAERRPEAPAVNHRGGSLTYGELDRRASLLARRLRAAGVGPESRVAVCMGKSPELFVALLGVLKSGGAYVPIDPLLPAARRSFMAADSGAAALLAPCDLTEDFPPGILRLDPASWENGSGAEGGRLDEGLVPSNLAYLIYTSGTSGTPKGVAVTHANLHSAFRAWEKAYGLRSLSTHLQMAAPGFDVFSGDLIRALGSGGCLVLCDRETLLDPPALAALAREGRVEFAEFVPAPLRELAAHLARRGERIESLRCVAVGSDTWTMADFDLFRRAFGDGVRWVNSYGVTEATIDSTLDDVREGEIRRAVPSIGRPLANSAAYVLDGHLEPLPTGVHGELFLGGAAVARGYAGRADLTAERFLPDPHGPSGARMYRTGDAARRLRDGRLEFIGRADTQVKIRGYRVEPAEIEEVLKLHPGVAACAVAAREHDAGRRLAAWFVPAGDPASAAALREYLSGRLPDYMVPAAFVPLSSLPLSANGKVDRRALPEPEWGEKSGTPGDAPLAGDEEILAAIWRAVLRIPRVGRDDNFFELGGDSILSIQVVARAREAGLMLTPRMLFEQPTVSGLALSAARAGAAAPEVAPFVGEAPLLPMQEWFFQQDFAEPEHWNMAMALEARGPLDLSAAKAALRALVDHHDALRARFPREGARRVQVMDPPGGGDADPLLLEARAGEDREAAAGRCAALLDAGVDLQKGPLIRFGIVWDGPRPSTLVIVAHHLVVDGVSLRLLAEDLDRAYRQALEGKPLRLPPRSLPAAAFAAALAKAAGDGRFDAGLASWRKLAGSPPAGIPSMREAEAATEETTRTVTVDLDEESTGHLLRAAASEGESPETLLLAALASAWRGSEAGGGGALYLELEGHGRDALPEIDLSRTVGWFTATRPVLIDGADPSDLPATLRRVSRTTGAEPGSGFSVMRFLSPDPAVREILRRVPSPPVSFNYLGRFEAAPEAGSIFTRLYEPSSDRRSPRARRTHSLEIDAAILDGRLSVRWSYSPLQIEEAAVRRIAASFRESLSAFVAPAPEAEEERLPLTPMQEGMLFHHLREPLADPYVSQIALELAGEVDPDLLARAWQGALEIHPALRASFLWEGLERPVQIIRRNVTLPVAVHEGGSATLEEILTGARAGGFDLSQAPLARVDLVRTGPASLNMIFTHHHLLLDGWSLPLLLGTVFDAYESLQSGSAAPAARPEVLRRYAAWLASQDPRKAEEYFRGALAGFDSPTPVPDGGGRLRPPSAGDASSCGVLHVSGPAGAAERARALGLTTSTLVQAAWALVLSASSDRRDVLFGSTSSGRGAGVEGIESLVGLCINTLPMRVPTDFRLPARDWMLELQRRGAELRQHESAPLALVQRCAEIPPNTPLFESLLVFENYPLDIGALGRRGRFRVASVRLHEETNYPLTLVATQEPALRFRAIYRKSRLDEAGVRRVLARLNAAMENLLSRPSAPLCEISVLPPEERDRVARIWNDTRREYPRESTVPEIFDQVARERGSAAALLFDGGEMSYAELREKARRAAAALRSRGIGPESRAALAMERSPELMVAILAVLYAGGAYVPVDPESPPGRTARMLSGAGVDLIVADPDSPLSGGEIPAVPFADLFGSGEEAPPLSAVPDGLAYVIFTSGSTGEPKGTEVSHRNILRLVLGIDYVKLGPEETILQLSPAAFDASTFEIFGALLTGGRLVVAGPGPLSVAEIARHLRRYGITTLWLTAGLFHLVADEEPEALARVPQVLAGGDVVSPAHVRRLLDAGCGRFVNGYGPTETTTFACCHPLAPGDEVEERVPVGRPVANARVYVLDASMRPAPIGAPGELFIGGDGVSRGYSRRPDLTAERFVPDPFGPGGSRLYRTGDRVRWRPDGLLDFLGRRDGQVKIRGFRVEVGEVEKALRAAPGILSAAVAARSVSGLNELVGYVVAGAGSGGDVEAIRKSLALRIPRYMIPGRFVFLDSLPLTPNGKVDRSALPGEGVAADRPVPARPMTPVEAALAELWRRVLGVEQVGPDDDFFELGGHSLHATRLLAAVRRAFRVELPMAALFEATTVASLARTLEIHQPSPGHLERAARALSKMGLMTGEEKRGALRRARGEVTTS
jgi:amino acid adenylation domain-containing protein/non-ribosomal peptide synthase protein (TIGR01720 family)